MANVDISKRSKGTGLMGIVGKIRHKLSRTGQVYREMGWGMLARLTLNRLLYPCFGFEANRIVWLPLENAADEQNLPDGAEFRFLTATEVAEYAQSGEFPLTEQLVKQAEQGTDRCYACLIHGELAAYGWYGVQAEVPADDFGLIMQVPAEAAYMHHGYTHPNYRGLRLHGIGMARALRELSAQGVRALLSDVDWTNQASLKSCERLGYQVLGTCFTYGWGNWRFSYATPGIQARNIHFRRAKPTSQPAQKELSEWNRRTANPTDSNTQAASKTKAPRFPHKISS